MAILAIRSAAAKFAITVFLFNPHPDSIAWFGAEKATFW
jgi:hypothetical protein